MEVMSMLLALKKRINKISRRNKLLTIAGVLLAILIAIKLNNYHNKLLLIENGTLTSEERKIVEMHVERTYQMLSKLKYPKDLERVPEIAASHHERMDGRGYPRGLKGREIPLRGRILAIADIFEALSAAGRSYKEPWKLSKVLQVMGKMCDDGHLDPDIFEIFLNQKVYLDYAKEFLSPEQNDL
ncbi:MAG: HD domain-containing protein [Chlamydiae bacterium]|nr:HD domain-containing protein [Chlamydiota bacterium]